MLLFSYGHSTKKLAFYVILDASISLATKKYAFMSPSNPWSPCKKGLLQKTKSDNGGPFGRRGFLVALAKYGGAAIFTAAGIRKYVDYTDEKPDPMDLFISCADVRDNLELYVLDNIDDCKLVAQINDHLTRIQCRSCLDRYDELSRQFRISVVSYETKIDS